jgi:alkaline phosphatase
MTRISFFAILALLSLHTRLHCQDSAILFNVDGAGQAHWMAARWAQVGPDGHLNWDKLQHVADYRNHVRDILVTGSNSGCTAHAYGVKVMQPSLGSDSGQPLKALSGKTLSIVEEAQAAGKSVALLNTADLTEAGTGAFLGHFGVPGKVLNYGKDMVEKQSLVVARQMIEAKPDVILAGGEVYLLPKGAKGRFGVEGKRTDGVNLVERAKELGYRIVYDREELLALPSGTQRVLGIFAANLMFNEDSEEGFAKSGLPLVPAGVPDVSELAAAALKIVSRNPKGFIMVVNDETMDNLSDHFNSQAVLKALSVADKTIGIMADYVKSHPRTLLLLTADASSGGFALYGRLPGPQRMAIGTKLPERDPVTGAPIDGALGTGSEPFLAAPDRNGQRLPFATAWVSGIDLAGNVLVRATGHQAELVRGSLDNTDIYRVLYAALFGITLK